MIDTNRIIYLHGLESNSQTHKAALVRAVYPDLVMPDFIGSLDERMRQLYPILGSASNWTLIGSSYGGLMAALFSTRFPAQVRKQLLLAPALMLPEFAENLPKPIDVPTIIKLAKNLFCQRSGRINRHDGVLSAVNNYRWHVNWLRKIFCELRQHQCRSQK